MKLSRRNAVIAAASVVIVVGVTAGVVVATRPAETPAARPTPTATPSPSPSVELPVPAYVAPSPEEIAALPEAMYSAVIPDLMPYTADRVPDAANAVYRIAADAPLYGNDRTAPVARFAAKNFLAQDSVIVPVSFEGDWALVLTPSRQVLPSESPDAPAQTVAWLPAAALTKLQDLSSHIVVSVGSETVSIVNANGEATQTFDAGVGKDGTPTPIGAVGYMQARYLDPAQNQEVYPIGLTSLHSAAADEPFGGTDGGLIGLHYQSNRDGAVSAGCVRLSGEAIEALGALPLGTPVLMQA